MSLAPLAAFAGTIPVSGTIRLPERKLDAGPRGLHAELLGWPGQVAASSTISFTTTYASTGATPMTYRIFVNAERM